MRLLARERARRGGLVALLAVLLALLLAACTGAGGRPAGHDHQAAGSARSAPPPGCGMTAPRLLTGLLGADARSTAQGGLAALRRDGTPATCRSVSRSTGTGRARSVTVRVVRHPDPLALPSLDCDQGWVYAGTPAKYVPACQQGRGRGGRTLLLARWGDYVVSVDIARDDRAWAGDPELGLALSKDVARRLGVAGSRGAAGQSASGSSS